MPARTSDDRRDRISKHLNRLVECLSEAECEIALSQLDGSQAAGLMTGTVIGAGQTTQAAELARRVRRDWRKCSHELDAPAWEERAFGGVTPGNLGPSRPAAPARLRLQPSQQPRRSGAS